MVGLPLLSYVLNIYKEINGTSLETTLSRFIFVMYLLFLFVVCYMFVLRFLFDVLCCMWNVKFLKCLLYVDLFESSHLLLMCLMSYVLFDILNYCCFSWMFVMVLVSLSVFYLRHGLMCKFT